MAFYAIGPGVCVWLALSELMPTRIRSNGMSIALVINQIVSTTLAAIFLPVVSNYGYSTMFFVFAGFTVVYFITAAFFLPETRAKPSKRSKSTLKAAESAEIDSLPYYGSGMRIAALPVWLAWSVAAGIERSARG